jgi:hypothetical protein
MKFHPHPSHGTQALLFKTAHRGAEDRGISLALAGHRTPKTSRPEAKQGAG